MIFIFYSVSVSGLVALGVAGGIVSPITAPLAAASIAKGIIIKKGEHFLLLELCFFIYANFSCNQRSLELSLFYLTDNIN